MLDFLKLAMMMVHQNWITFIRPPGNTLLGNKTFFPHLLRYIFQLESTTGTWFWHGETWGRHMTCQIDLKEAVQLEFRFQNTFFNMIFRIERKKFSLKRTSMSSVKVCPAFLSGWHILCVKNTEGLEPHVTFLSVPLFYSR